MANLDSDAEITLEAARRLMNIGQLTQEEAEEWTQQYVCQSDGNEEKSKSSGIGSKQIGSASSPRQKNEGKDG